MTGIRYINHQATNPVSGDMRQNLTLNCMEIYNGSSWTPVTNGPARALTLAEWIEEAQDRVGLYVDEDHKDNPTIQDAYNEWVSACQRFRIIANMAEK